MLFESDEESPSSWLAYHSSYYSSYRYLLLHVEPIDISMTIGMLLATRLIEWTSKWKLLRRGFGRNRWTDNNDVSYARVLIESIRSGFVVRT